LAYKLLQLDRVWWLVSPKNPLKTLASVSIEKRLHFAQSITQDHCSWLAPYAIEQSFKKPHYTQITLEILSKRFPNIQFIWLMGADNLSQFFNWYRWKTIMRTQSIAIFSRPSYRFLPYYLTYFRHNRLGEHQGKQLGNQKGYWMYSSKLNTPLSSTQLRHCYGKNWDKIKEFFYE
jgi:nicotinate-nucleotide adenylyltransferase